MNIFFENLGEAAIAEANDRSSVSSQQAVLGRLNIGIIGTTIHHEQKHH